MPTYNWEIRDISDNGEFLTFATIDLLEDGAVVESHDFIGSSEFPGDCDAQMQAESFGFAWYETMTLTIEERLGEFGLEWQREENERRGWAA